MKTELTTEQSQYLIELGVPIVNATILGELYELEDGSWDYQRLFSLTDLLEILPKEIEIDNKKYGLFTEFNSQYAFAYYYSVNTTSLGCQRKEEFIDALYELTIWCIENGHLKFK